ncbi:hypothetical protein IWZ03DRAFT_390704 [Phyllosticta citriasiana]|uniref:Uncharacterized protein n=1 Tax=Phyllosticta citriasiana TaxID=595635 RepID=A0ABR1K7Q2_9PEZI
MKGKKHPRRLSLSLSALPDTPFLGALDVSRLAEGEERVFRVPGSPSSAVSRARGGGGAETASMLSSTFDMNLDERATTMGKDMGMRRHGSAPQRGVRGTACERSGDDGRRMTRHSYDETSTPARDRTPSSSASHRSSLPRHRSHGRHTTAIATATTPSTMAETETVATIERAKDAEKEELGEKQSESAMDKEVDGIARRLAFAIKNGRAKGSRAVKVSWVVGF